MCVSAHKVCLPNLKRRVCLSRDSSEVRGSPGRPSPDRAELRAQSRTIARGERTSRTVRFRTEARRESLSPTKMGKTGRLKL